MKTTSYLLALLGLGLSFFFGFQVERSSLFASEDLRVHKCTAIQEGTTHGRVGYFLSIDEAVERARRDDNFPTTIYCEKKTTQLSKIKYLEGPDSK